MSIKKACHTAVFILALASLFACGGEQSAAPLPAVPVTQAPPPAAEPLQAQATAAKPEKSEISADFNAANLALYLDQDKDGLVDAIDNDPLTPLRVVSGEGTLQIASIATDIDGYLADNTVIAGKSITGKLLNSDRYSAPFYLLWHSPQGIQAQQVVVDAQGHFTVAMDEVVPTGVSIAAQGVESKSIMVIAYSAQAPLIFKQTKAIYTEEPLVFEGIHLDKISELRIGKRVLDFTLEQNTIVARIPKGVTSNVLTWKAGMTEASKVLPLLRKVKLVTDDTIAQAHEWSAISEYGKILLSRPNNSVMALSTISLPVNNKATFLRFYHPSHRKIEAVIWPDSDSIILGTQSTLERHMLNRLSSSLHSNNLEAVKAVINTSFNSDAGQDALARINLLHAQAFSVQMEASLEQEVDNMLSLLSAQIEGIQNDSHKAFLLNNQSSSSLFDYFDDTFAAIFANNVMYQPISKIVSRPTQFGASSYSEMNISLHRDLLTCAGIESLNKPSGIWPSDLCARNEGVYFASVKVTNALTNKVLKTHIKTFIDSNLIGASGWGLLSLDPIAFITSDSGAPLCHMQICQLEFVTGGLGFTTNVSMTKEQQKVYNIVLGRTLLERVVLPIVSELLGLATVDGNITKCLATHITTKAPTSLVSYGIMIADFKAKIDAASRPDDIENILKETVTKYAYDVAASMLSTNELPKCLPAALSQSFFASLQEQVKDFAKKAAIPLRIAETATLLFQGYQAINTPETFTFEVAPRASITSVRTSSSDIDDAIPELFSTNDDDKLFIRGTKFVYLKSDNTNYWPKLRLQDRFGSKQTLQLNESHKVDISDFSWVDIAIPVSDLKPLMEKLRGDIINVSILMDDNDYSAFTSEGLPVIGRDIRWVGQAKVFRATPQNARRGRLITLNGENLQPFGSRNDLKLRLIQANDASKTGEIFKVESATASQIKFRLPQTELPLNFYKLRLETSDPNVQLDVPDDIKIGNLTGALNVLPQSASLVELYDAGAKIDDAIIIYIANANGDISQNGNFLSLELLEDNPLPAVSMWWLNEDLTAQNGGSTNPGQILVTCDAGGTDQICTYRVKGEINVAGKFESINFRGKLQSGDSIAHSFP